MRFGLELVPIGIIRSCFDEKFGTPRQPGLAPTAEGRLLLSPPYDRAESLRGLEAFSHVWLLFGFHANATRDWTPTVRPPRLGGNRRTGVFATRSPYRPNALGLSVVENVAVLDDADGTGLRLRNLDLIDGTPVYDVKPYLPYADAPAHAHAPEVFSVPPARRRVVFSVEAERALAGRSRAFRSLLVDTLSLDPRPAYRAGESAVEHGVTLAGVNVRWRVVGNVVEVLSMDAV
ncbi:MAG TPA: tRNA (N6-threonylcarbamoyladenosine(37)-N6)-methyltransferase TrmO [Gammaproteobacteria bacterium]|nr:tRNA (N6-threonylcarbamoyladenosine(37)-N6)-methyltransferase TrmO [Gammaproteobacteria bacterium]